MKSLSRFLADGVLRAWRNTGWICLTALVLPCPRSAFADALPDSVAPAHQQAGVDFAGITPVTGMIEQEFTTGSMIITGMTLSDGTAGAPVVRPIVGGTGDYGGVSGEASSLQVSSGVWKKSARMWR